MDPLATGVLQICEELARADDGHRAALLELPLLRAVLQIEVVVADGLSVPDQPGVVVPAKSGERRGGRRGGGS